MKIAVVGGGLAGCSVAWRLRLQHDVVVYEPAGRAGGVVRSERFEDFVFDCGPNGFLSNAPEIGQLVDEVGLRERCVPAASAAKRYIYWDGRLHAVPSKPPQALATRLVSPLAKLSALRDVFARPQDTDPDESVDAFFRRHFGEQVARRIVATALLGITAGDSTQTSVGALFPRLLELQREHGSIVRAGMRARRSPGTLTSFPAGMQSLSDALMHGLGERLRTNTTVTSIARDGAGWRVRSQGDGDERFDALVLATPADVTAALLESVDGALGDLLRGIEYVPMRVAGIAFARADVPGDLDAFGFLAARGQGVRILGALYTSSLFPSQAPPDVAYFRVFLGGAFDPQAATCDAETARAIVREDLRRVLGIEAAPQSWHEVVWPRAIPQYALGHAARVRAIESRAQTLGAIGLTGNAYRGVGVADVVRDAFAVAGKVEVL
ncbi:MAG TPA: protoporphyrinogen oxidase [Candidatus Tumulicola sp.]